MTLNPSVVFKILLMVLCFSVIYQISQNLTYHQNWGIQSIIYLQQYRNKPLDVIMRVGSLFGFEILVLAIPVLSWTHSKRLQLLGIQLTHYAIFGLYVVTILKNYFQELRPYQVTGDIRGDYSGALEFSFPSGHTWCSTICWIVLGRYLMEILPSRKIVISFFVVFFSCFVGFSRVYFGVHYPHDVICGLIGGFFIFEFHTLCFEVQLIYDDADVDDIDNKKVPLTKTRISIFNDKNNDKRTITSSQIEMIHLTDKEVDYVVVENTTRASSVELLHEIPLVSDKSNCDISRYSYVQDEPSSNLGSSHNRGHFIVNYLKPIKMQKLLRKLKSRTFFQSAIILFINYFFFPEEAILTNIGLGTLPGILLGLWICEEILIRNRPLLEETTKLTLKNFFLRGSLGSAVVSISFAIVMIFGTHFNFFINTVIITATMTWIHYFAPNLFIKWNI